MSDYVEDGGTTFGQISLSKDILENNNYLLQDITTLSGLLNSFYNNLTKYF